MATHPAVVTVGKGKPLAIHQVPTSAPVGNEVRVRNEWTASTPLDLHQAMGGLLVTPPQILGDGVAGEVVECGPDVQHLQVGDRVFGFTYRSSKEKAHQIYVVAEEVYLGKIPDGFSMQQVVVVPNNFVTAWWTLKGELGMRLPWPKEEGYMPDGSDEWILVWGGGSSVGQYVLQLLRYYGHKNVIVTAGKSHWKKLTDYGAFACLDYRDTDVVARISDVTGNKSVKTIIDCIGSQDNSIRPISMIAKSGTEVAIMLPIIVRDAAEDIEPIYEMDVVKCAAWAKGVKAIGVRTHFYPQDEYLREHLQRNIMPEALEKGIVEANERVVVEGASLLERAEKALVILKNRGVSGARLVWRVADA